MYRLIMIATLLLICLPTFAATVNVKDFGAAADGKTDDTAAFQKTLDEAAKTSGSTAFAPAGSYLIAGTLTIPGSTTLQGEYSGPGRQRGTILLITGRKGETEGKGTVHLAGVSTLKNVAFTYPEQTADAKEPVPYPYTITAGGDARIEEIFLLNSYQGINLDGSHANLVRNVWGEPLKVGINADHVYDISRIENIHFWPYFTLNKPLRSWVQANGVAFQFGRSDWQYCFNTFSYGYHIGYKFYTSKEVKQMGYPGGQTNGNFVGIGADCAGICIDVEDSFAIGVSITNGEFAPFGGGNTRGVLLHKGNTGNLTLVNCNFWAVTYNVAEVQDGSLNMSSCNIHNWAEVKKDTPAFLVSGGRLNVNNCTFNKGGLLATLEGDTTKAIFSGNMGTDSFTVVNGIDNRAVFGLNNPEILTTKPGAAAPGPVKPTAPKPKKEHPPLEPAGKNMP